MHSYTTLITLILIMLQGCANMNDGLSGTQKDGPPPFKVDVSKINSPKPTKLVKSKYGNPDSYTVFGKRYHTLEKSKGYRKKGIASWYGTKFHGRRTSSGEPYNMFAMTAAHKTLPIPTYARVRNLDNQKEIIVKINDRGPFHEGRIIDLSYVAAQKLGIHGTGRVEVETIHFPANGPRQFYLQVGAFGELKNARKLSTHLQQSLKVPVDIKSAKRSDSQMLHKVHVGPFADLQRVASLEEKLTAQGHKSMYTIVHQ